MKPRKRTVSVVRYIIRYKTQPDWSPATYYSEATFKLAQKWLIYLRERENPPHSAWIELMVQQTVYVPVDEKGEMK